MGNLLCLVPNSPDNLLLNLKEKVRLIDQVLHFTDFGELAMSAYENGDISKFDPHVGETQCQIRAYKIIQTFETKEKDITTLKTDNNTALSLKLGLIKLKKEVLSTSPSKKNYISTADFLKQGKLNLNFSDTYLFLTCSYFLTFFANRDSEGVTQSVNYQLMKQTIGESNTYCMRLTKQLQKWLSADSISFILELCDTIPNYGKTLKRHAKLLTRVGDYDRKTIPNYLSTKIILEHIQANGGAITLHVNTTCTQKKYHKTYHLRKGKAVSKAKPSFTLVIYGVALSMNAFRSNCINNFTFAKDLILSNMSAHPQYSGKSLKRYCSQFWLDLNIDINSQEFELIKKLINEHQMYSALAKKLGCTINNPNTFFLKHIYASRSPKSDKLPNILPSYQNQMRPHKAREILFT